MKYIFKCTAIVLLLATHIQAQAIPSQVLPQKPSLRPEGIQQIGLTCHATSFLTALEHHFQRLDKPVKLSLSGSTQTKVETF